jgi:hypothetical protein
MPVELDGYTYGGDTTEYDLEHHAAGAGVQIGLGID